MSMGVCLADLRARGIISQQRHDELDAVYRELVEQYEPRMGRGAAEAKATEDAMKMIDADFLHRKRQKMLQVRAQAAIHDGARRTYDGGKYADGVLPGRALLASLVRDEKAGGIPNVEYRWRNIKQSALAQIYDILDRHRANLAGVVRHKEDLSDLVRELNDQSTGNVSAREMADAWKGAAEWLRGRFNQAGGRIGKLEGWALPHRHDGDKVGAIGADAWIAAITPRLDRAKMLDRDTGLPLNDGKLALVLRDVYETIVSDGWNGRSPGGMGGRSIGNRYGEHRVLHFRSADDWLAYNERFGQGTPFDAMMSHIERMSRDIAAMEILGPNPAATIQWMADLADKEAATKGGLRDRGHATVDRHRIEAVWRELQGQNRRAVNRNLALFGSTLRNWQSSTKLGSATLASLSDHATRELTRIYNGLPAMQTMGQYLKQLNPLDAGDREFARRAAIIGDEFTGRMAAQGRMHMEDAFGGRLSGGYGRLGENLQKANELSRRLADGVLRASGLNAHTIAGREAAGMDFMAALAQFSGRDFDALNAPFRKFLQRYGIERQGWDTIRSSPMTDYKGARWIRPDDIADVALRDRMMEAMLTEIDFAVPSGGLYTRAMVNLAPPGTIMGELMRTGFQFKMFPVTVIAMHGARMMAQSHIARRAGYAAAFLGSTTLMGMLSYQMSEISKGKDPRPMRDPDFIWRSALKGGGLGVFGDAIEFSRNQYGQDIWDITKGPSASTVQNLTNAGKAAFASAAPDAVFIDDPDAVGKAAKLRGRAARDLLTREVPGSSLWYVRAAYERLLVDTVAGWAEGETVDDRYRRLEKRAAKTGQGYWAPPGGSVQEWRLPDVENALAAPPR